jgi:NADH-quinone oxidoreductase subunit A
MTTLAAYLLLFLVLSIVFVFFHLMLGKMVRPARPDPEKLTIYECGEPTIGSSWIQFDLRFYVVALLFVIFDVEAVFFFPWAVVFGKATTLADPNLPVFSEKRNELTSELVDTRNLMPGGEPLPLGTGKGEVLIAKEDASQLAWLGFWDILVFFGVLLVGFAYLWKRGDLDWVRSTLAEQVPVATSAPAAAGSVPATNGLVGAARTSV